MAGVGGQWWGGKGRQLYLNNNRIKTLKKKINFTAMPKFTFNLIKITSILLSQSLSHSCSLSSSSSSSRVQYQRTECKMTTSNHAILKDTWHSMIGIPGLEDEHTWISIPLCSMYTVALVGNTLLLFLIIKHSPHEPINLFLSVLAVVDIFLSTVTTAKC